MVTMLAAIETPVPVIAIELGISEYNVKNSFRAELAFGLERIGARIGLKATQRALAGDNAMIRLWLERRLADRWKGGDDPFPGLPGGSAAGVGAQATASVQINVGSSRQTMVRLPPNGRDDLPPTIDGVAEPGADKLTFVRARAG